MILLIDFGFLCIKRVQVAPGQLPHKVPIRNSCRHPIQSCRTRVHRARLLNHVRGNLRDVLDEPLCCAVLCVYVGDTQVDTAQRLSKCATARPPVEVRFDGNQILK